MNKLLTVHEAAEALRVSRSTIWRWCRDGTLSSAFKIGRNWRIHRSEVEEILGQSLINTEDANTLEYQARPNKNRSIDGNSDQLLTMSEPLFSSSLGHLSVDELARRCRQETKKFLAGSAYDEAYGLELFSRALLNHDQTAWRAIYAQYQPLVAYWVRHHDRFQSTNEEAMFFVNAAFARFSCAASKQVVAIQFHDLTGLLRYLKSCVHSTIEDECRRQRRWPRDPLAWDDFSEAVTDDAPSLEERTISKVMREALEWAVLSRLQDEEEVVVAILSWMYDLRPKEIQARRPDLFTDVQRVYGVKRNILNRLLRDPGIRQLRRRMHYK